MRQVKPLSYIFFIFSIFYAPVLSPFFPKTNFGAGIPDLGLFELSLFLWILFFLLDFSSKILVAPKQSNSKLWLFNLGFYSLIIAASVSWSTAETYNIANIRDLSFTVFLPFLIAFIARYYISVPSVLSGIIWHAMFSCLLLSIVSIFHFVMYQGADLKTIRASFGGLGNPNGMAIFLVMNVPVVLYGLHRGMIAKKISFLALFAIALGVCGTISRKGFATLGMTYFIYLFLSKQFKLLTLFTCFFLLLTTAVLGQRYMSQRYSRTSINKEFVGKWNMVLAGVDMFKKKPLYGWGYKGYYNSFGRYFKYSVRRKYNAHNNYVTALANYGLLGFIPFMGIFLYPLVKSFGKIWSNKDLQSEKTLAAITLLSIIFPFMCSAWFAGKLMYKPVITNLLYVYIVLFLFKLSEPLSQSKSSIGV